MRQVSAQILDETSLGELASGHRLELVRGGKRIAEIVPVTEEFSSQIESDDTAHRGAVRRLREMMDQGMHLGGLRIANRDELYDRD